MKRFFYGIAITLLMFLFVPNVSADVETALLYTDNEIVDVKIVYGMGDALDNFYFNKEHNYYYTDSSFIDKAKLEEDDYKLKLAMTYFQFPYDGSEPISADSNWNVRAYFYGDDGEYTVYQETLTGQQLIDTVIVELDLSNVPMNDNYRFDMEIINVADETDWQSHQTGCKYESASDLYCGFYDRFFIGNKYGYSFETKIDNTFGLSETGGYVDLKGFFDAFESFEFSYQLTTKEGDDNYNLKYYHCTYVGEDAYEPSDEDTCVLKDSVDNVSLGTKYFTTVVNKEYYDTNLATVDYLKFDVYNDTNLVKTHYYELFHDVEAQVEFTTYTVTDSTGHNVLSDYKSNSKTVTVHLDGINFIDDEVYYVRVAGTPEDYDNYDWDASFKTYTGKELNEGIDINVTFVYTKDSIDMTIYSNCSFNSSSTDCGTGYYSLEMMHYTDTITITDNSANFKKLTVKNLTAKGINYNQVSLDFDDVEGATGYVIYRSTKKTSGYKSIGTSTTSNFVDKGASVNKTYYYKVKAYSSVNGTKVYSKESNIVSAKAVLLKPTITVKDSNYNSNKISYAKVAGSSGYQIYRATSEKGKYTLVKTTTSLSYTDTKLTTGKTYYYKVRAYRTISGKKYYSSYSSVLSAKPTVNAPTVTVTSYDYNINKIAITKKPSGASGYAIYRSDSIDGTYSLIGTTTKTTYYDKNLETGKTYYYKIRAYRTVSSKKVYGYYTDVMESTPTLRTPKVTVKNTSRDSLTLNIEPVNGADGYYVYEVIDGVRGEENKITDTTITFEQLELGSNHTYEVVAYRNIEDVEYLSFAASEEATVKPGAVLVNVKTDAYNKQTVTINVPHITAEDNVKVYIYQSTSKNGKYTLYEEIPQVVPEAGYVASKTFTGLKFNTTYYYKAVVEINGVKSNESAIKSAKTALLTPNTTVASYSYTSLKISWDKVEGASGYQIYRATSKNGKYSLIKTTTSTSYIDKSKTTGKNYYYKVRAYRTVSGKKYYSAYSSIKSAYPAVKAPSVTVTNYDYNTNKITITKKPSGATGYAIYRSDTIDGEYKLVTRTTKTTFYDKGLETGKTYYYKVRAYRTVSKSNKYGFYTEVMESTPTLRLPKYEIKNTSRDALTINIEPVNGADGYYVYEVIDGVRGDANKITDTTITFNQLELGSSHSYEVVAYRDVNGVEQLSNVNAVSVTVKPAPINLTVNIDSFHTQTVTAPLLEVTDSDVAKVHLYYLTSKDGEYTLIDTVSIAKDDNGLYSASSTIANLKLNTTYYYKAVLEINGVMSEESEIVSKKAAVKPDIALVNYTYNQIMIGTTYDVEIDGYQVYRATSKNGKYTKVYDGAENVASIKGTFNKKYYYKIRYYKTYDGKKVYSAFSDAKLLKTGVQSLDDYPITLEGDFGNIKVKSTSLTYKKTSGDYVYYRLKVNYDRTYATKKTNIYYTVNFLDWETNLTYTYNLYSSIPKGIKRNWYHTFDIKIPKSAVYYYFE